MIVRFGPAGVMKTHRRISVVLFESKPDPSSSPVTVGLGKLNLEFLVGFELRNFRDPVVSRSKTQNVIGIGTRRSGTGQRPPRIQTLRCRHCFKHARRGRLYWEMLKYVMHISLPLPATFEIPESQACTWGLNRSPFETRATPHALFPATHKRARG